jgi:hypothetical protein
VRCCILIDSFKLKFDRLNTNLTEYKFDYLRSKNSKKIKTRRLFYVSCLNILYNYFLKFVVYKMNSEMFKFGMLMLTRRENVDMVDADITVG